MTVPEAFAWMSPEQAAAYAKMEHLAAEMRTHLTTLKPPLEAIRQLMMEGSPSADLVVLGPSDLDSDEAERIGIEAYTASGYPDILEAVEDLVDLIHLSSAEIDAYHADRR